MNFTGITLQFLTKLLTTFLFLPSDWSLRDQRTTCLSLGSRLHLENTTIIHVSYVPGGSKVHTLGTSRTCAPTAIVTVPLCRVQFFTNTTDTSSVHAEAWLPDEWYGRFLGLGNGGLGGCIDYNRLDYGAALHFATVGSDNGHDGAGGLPFLGRPEVINDFAFRAIHIEAVIGKQIAEAYYGQPHDKAYYLGCSTGGRQGTQAALKYPADFDGILAGAPATDFNHLVHWVAMLSRSTGAPTPASSPAYIPLRLWKVVTEEVLNQCDAIDGVLDGIITEPDACDFRPQSLLCYGGAGVNDTCLSLPQVEALQRIYSPLQLNGRFVYPRYDPGAEGNPESIEIFNGQIPSNGEDWIKYAVFNDTEFDFRNYGNEHLVVMDKINPGGISTFDGDLSAFRDRGGKFLTYHGRMDHLIASGNSKRFYDLVADTLGTPSLDDFYRLFLIPGMGHCLGGPGASNFGQLGAGTNAVNQSSHNILLALVDWVEGGVELDTITGTTTDGAHTRVHCRYPATSVWDGSAFVCS
ncbi:tannase and feruloyl esterase [Mycena pura]|uniref:Carboxylic ester hydrolase n=1 Tax=Mycena pura TaxID=153505 RepID=A0AAD6YDH5_9AGAR|nr:tannase and feruloyl esterase [Mycena pura]